MDGANHQLLKEVILVVYDCFTALPTASLAVGPWWGHGELDQETVVPDAGELSSIDAEPSDEAMV